ncbi:M16 family metallopeptidase [Campylobacter sp.]|uniref:M16 family metallopeptidase n=1 Tax=Campylobacter sp. TaxID=205 RepID=UPI00270D408D|nr:insulinase family protein [Campylobacter sp.]
MKKIVYFALFIICFANELKPDFSIYSATLNNGFSYHIKEVKSEFVYFHLIVQVGSSDEENFEQGIAHFCEHMAFNGTNTYSKTEFLKRLNDIGVFMGQGLNAQTSFDVTEFKIQVKNKPKNLDIALETLKLIAEDLSFDELEVQKEKGIILEERRAIDTADYKLFKERSEFFYADSIYKNRMPIGDIEVVKNMNSDLLRNFYLKHYQPKNMQLIIIGDIAKEKVEDSVKKYFGALKNSNFIKKKKPTPILEGNNIFYTSSEEVNVYFQMQRAPITNEKELKNSILSLFLSKMLQLIYNEKNSISDQKGYMKFQNINIANQKLLYNFSMDKNSTQSLKEFASVLKTVKENGFEEDYFNEVKRQVLKEIFKRYSNSLQPDLQIEAIAQNLQNKNINMNPRYEFNVMSKIVNNLNSHELNAFTAEILNIKNVIFEIPKDDIVDKEEIEAIFRDSKILTLPKLNSKQISLLEYLPSKGQIASREFDSKLGVSIFRLSNDIKVVFKYAKGQKDVNLYAIKRGGLSISDDPRLDKVAVAIANMSGVGKFSDYEIKKAFKNIAVAKFINEVTSGYRATANKRELKNLFEILHLDMLAPKLGYKAFLEFKEDARNDLKKRLNTSRYIFETQLNDLYYGHNNRVKELGLSDYENMDFNSLQKSLKNIFEPDDFTFIIIGDISLKELRSMLEIYVASLPTKGKRTNFKDDGVRGKEGVHVFKKDGNPFDKDNVSIFIKNDNAVFDDKKQEAFMASLSILKTLIHEQIREDEGRIYDIAIEGALLNFPYPHSFVQISFTSKPNTGDKISEEIRKIILKFSSQNIDKSYLENYKKITDIRIARELKEPEIIIGKLVNHFLLGDEFLSQSDKKNIINDLSVSDIRNAFAKHLGIDNYFTAILSP